MKTIWLFIVHTLYMFLLALLISSIIKINVELPVKIIIALSFVLLILSIIIISVRMDEVRKLLVQILYFQRVSYIAIERKRLDPEDQTPARDIVVEDMKNEKEEKTILEKMEREAAWPLYLFLYPFIGAIWLFGVIFMCIIFLKILT